MIARVRKGIARMRKGGGRRVSGFAGGNKVSAGVNGWSIEGYADKRRCGDIVYVMVGTRKAILLCACEGGSQDGVTPRVTNSVRAAHQ